MDRVTSLRWLGGLALVGALVLMDSNMAVAQFRVEFQPQRRQIVVAPQRATTSYTFGARRHVDDLAARMARQANEICLEMHYNYRHNPGYRETYREMYQVLQDSKHIHELVHHDHYHHTRNRQDDHIARDLVEMDSLVHHIEEDIARWAPAHSHHAHGHHAMVHGQSQNLHRLMDQFAENLHHLMTDYGVKSQLGPGGEAPPPDAGATAPPPDGGVPPRPQPR
jgi:hypothetical protein